MTDLQQRILTGEDRIRVDALRGRTIAVLGFGNQGRAHALNLRDSGLHIVVGARPEGPGTASAREAGFDVRSIADATAAADLVIVALPDEIQPEVYRESIAPALKPGAVLGFLHGFAVRYGFIEPPENIGVVLVAPKGPGATLRERFTEGRGLPCLLAVHQESPDSSAEETALAWAAGLGAAKAGVIRTTFAIEAETDLFGEQAVLCGGMTWLILAAFETLVDAGYPPELAYLECCHEVKQIADLVYARGPAAMMEAISTTAEFGAHQAGPHVVDDHVRSKLRDILSEIRDGRFAQSFRADHEQGGSELQRNRKTLAEHPIEEAGRTVRALMPWLIDRRDPRE